MSEQQIHDKLAEALHVRATTCERGPIAIREDGLAGVGIVAPNSKMLAICLTPGFDLPIFDFWLN